MSTDQEGTDPLKPLAGIRVLDLTQVVAGPFCTMMLANLGADVAKVEPPGRGDDLRYVGRYPGRERHEDYFNATNNSKRSLILDLKDGQHREVAHALVGRADIFVENFAPATAGRLGMGWAELHALNPRLLYCSISGFGQTGPDSLRPAMDPIIQAVTGIMSVTGQADSGPTAVGAPLADVIAGMWGAYAIVGALHAVRRSGQGCHVDISMQAAMMATLGPRMGGSLNDGIAPQRIGNQNPMRAPSDVYRTRDGRHVFLMIHHNRVWAPFCRAFGRPQWIDDARYADNQLRCANRDALNTLLHERFATLDADAILGRLRAERVPCSLVNNYVEAAADAQVVDRKLIQEVEHRDSGRIRVVGPPWLVDGAAPRVGAPPALNEHLADVLGDWLGWTAEQIEQLRAPLPPRPA